MNGVGGPVGVIGTTMFGASKGPVFFFFLLAFISINLAILNLIPVPILDGGQILFTTIEAVIRRQIPLNIRLVVHYICWVSFMALALYLTYADIRRIIWG
jgi:regulator of sigma E protease